ncbi:hypothetical protein [Natronoglomus mannanivorans]|uniref:Uncharacterized protein n=1 Tax=Natronoglomus mannanivorans TaxID=2979990 RepID=A0AAP3E440_9EURY|nr:hypothetical protein [Halobacteria archaeon AArc-xg1-1]
MSRTFPAVSIDLTLLRTLFREEWRLHAQLFGGRRFLGFPAIIAILVAAAAVALSATGTSTDAIVTGLHVFVFAFGLYSGTAGFAGSDMLENVFGDLSLVLSSSTTLPLSRRRLLGIFLVKDALYYGVLFVLPMASGLAPLLEGAHSVTLPLAIVALWGSLFALFVAGMVVTVAGIALRTRGVPGWVLAIAAGTGALALWTTGTHSQLWTLFAGDGATGTAMLTVSTLALGAVALRVYDPTYSRPSRTATDRFATLERALPLASAERGLVAKTLLDLGRSSGGFWKPLVSTVILLALVAAMVGIVGEITGIEPAPGIFFGGVLGLSAFTTYNWLTQFDRVEAYLAYPVSVEAVFRAKRTAFVLVNGPTVALPYVGAVLWFGATPRDVAVGAVLLAGYSLYYYGLTVFLAGFDPNEFLFDAVRFATFTLGVAVVLVPTLVAGFVVVPPSWPITLALGCSGLLFGAVGFVLSERAGSKWERVYQSG